MKTKILITAFFFILSVACEDDLQSIQFAAGDEVELTVGQIVTSNDDKISLEIIEINDSRCPSDVQCIWQGEAKIKFELNDNGKTEFTLTTLDPEPDTINNYIFTLKDVSPYPISTQVLELDDYVVTVLIEEI